MDVTPKLQSLTNEQQAILHQEYTISEYTYMSSIFAKNGFHSNEKLVLKYVFIINNLTIMMKKRTGTTLTTRMTIKVIRVDLLLENRYKDANCNELRGGNEQLPQCEYYHSSVNMLEEYGNTRGYNVMGNDEKGGSLILILSKYVGHVQNSNNNSKYSDLKSTRNKQQESQSLEKIHDALTRNYQDLEDETCNDNYSTANINEQFERQMQLKQFATFGNQERQRGQVRQGGQGAQGKLGRQGGQSRKFASGDNRKNEKGRNNNRTIVIAYIAREY